MVRLMICYRLFDGMIDNITADMFTIIFIRCIIEIDYMIKSLIDGMITDIINCMIDDMIKSVIDAMIYGSIDAMLTKRLNI